MFESKRFSWNPASSTSVPGFDSLCKLCSAKPGHLAMPICHFVSLFHFFKRSFAILPLPPLGGGGGKMANKAS